MIRYHNIDYMSKQYNNTDDTSNTLRSSNLSSDLVSSIKTTIKQKANSVLDYLIDSLEASYDCFGAISAIVTNFGEWLGYRKSIGSYTGGAPLEEYSSISYDDMKQLVYTYHDQSFNLVGSEHHISVTIPSLEDYRSFTYINFIFSKDGEEICRIKYGFYHPSKGEKHWELVEDYFENLYLKYGFDKICEDVQSSMDLNTVLSEAARIISIKDSFNVSDFTAAIKTKFKGLKGDAYSCYASLVDSFSTESAEQVFNTMANYLNTIAAGRIKVSGDALSFTDNSVYNMSSMLSGIVTGTLSTLSSLVTTLGVAIGGIFGGIIAVVGTGYNLVSSLCSAMATVGTTTTLNFQSDDFCEPLAIQQVSFLDQDLIPEYSSIVRFHNFLCDSYVWKQSDGNSTYNEIFLNALFSPDKELTNSIVDYIKNHVEMDYTTDSAGSVTLQYFKFNTDHGNMVSDLKDEISYYNDSLWGPSLLQQLSTKDQDNAVRHSILNALLFYSFLIIPEGHYDEELREWTYYTYIDKNEYVIEDDKLNMRSFINTMIWMIKHDDPNWGSLFKCITLLNDHINRRNSILWQQQWTTWCSDLEDYMRYVALGFNNSKLSIATIPVYKSHSFCTWPEYDGAECTAAIAITTAIGVATAGVLFGSFMVARSFIRKKRAAMMAKTEQAWTKYTENPNKDTAKAYRKCAFKQNTIGKLFGCQRIDNTCYWDYGTSEEDDGTSVVPVDSDLIISMSKYLGTN